MWNHKGFTLLELMITVLIIGIAGSLAIPSLGSWLGKQDLNAAARTMAAHFNRARSEAVKQNQEMLITITSGTPGSYVIKNQDGATVVPQTTLKTGLKINSSDITFASNVTGFSARGFSTNAGSVTIRSSKAPSSGNYRTIAISSGGSVVIKP